MCMHAPRRRCLAHASGLYMRQADRLKALFAHMTDLMLGEGGDASDSKPLDTVLKLYSMSTRELVAVVSGGPLYAALPSVRHSWRRAQLVRGGPAPLPEEDGGAAWRHVRAILESRVHDDAAQRALKLHGNLWTPARTPGTEQLVMTLAAIA